VLLDSECSEIDLEDFYSLYEKIEINESATAKSVEQLIVPGKLVKECKEISSRFIFKTGPEDTFKLSIIEININ
jgi:hypothetical protein